MKRRATSLAALTAALLASTVASALLVAPGQAAASGSQRPAPRIDSRSVSFEVVNRNETAVPCLPGPDGRPHTLRGRLIGPADVVAGRGGVETFHVLVHDAGTGGWFWNLSGRGVPASADYATSLARAGETVLVLDRLGYDRSPLASGATCLGAQASMLNGVVQSLYSGTYRISGARYQNVPHASHVVLHGHGTGATVARLEAATFGDVQALVLMSPVTSSPSRLALQTLQGQSATCLRGAKAAPYGASNADFRRLLFASAPTSVQSAASRLRNSTPCGDVASLASAVLASQGQRVGVPTLVLTGGADARRGGDGISAGPTTRLVRRSYAGAGSALPLEEQAPAVRRTVLRFVGGLDDTVR